MALQKFASDSARGELAYADLTEMEEREQWTSKEAG
jgi:hypothetical protein